MIDCASVSQATFRFYGSLNDFLPPARRQMSFEHRFDGRVSIKDAIESLGVPHPEVDLVLADGTPVGFSCHLQPGNRVAVYPQFRELAAGPVSLVRPPGLDQLNFVLDTHLGRLTAYLRLAGFDCLYWNVSEDEELAAISSRQKRVLLTRDAALLKRAIVEHGYWVRSTDPRRQLVEVSRRFDLVPRVQPFRRCLRCNALIEEVAKAAIADRLPPRTRAHYHEFYRCPGCDRIYWKGAHWERLRVLLDTIDTSEGPRSEGLTSM
jgi:hypothetical protein